NGCTEAPQTWFDRPAVTAVCRAKKVFVMPGFLRRRTRAQCLLGMALIYGARSARAMGDPNAEQKRTAVDRRAWADRVRLRAARSVGCAHVVDGRRTQAGQH